MMEKADDKSSVAPCILVATHVAFRARRKCWLGAIMPVISSKAALSSGVLRFPDYSSGFRTVMN
jgi:hypothetical protein